jgi:hypothetical protein
MTKNTASGDERGMLVNSQRHNIYATLYCFSFLFKRALPRIQLPLR